MNTKESIFCYAKINARVQPMDRGDLFEDPLQEALEESGLGNVSGGGTMIFKSGEIEYVGVDIDLYDKDKGIAFVCENLSKLGAPKGSVLEIGEERYPFGFAEGIGVYVDGVNLPDEVYEQCDINVVWDELQTAVEGVGAVFSYWQGPQETALYLYGKSAAKMRELIAGFIGSYPLCKGARVENITPVG